VPNLLQYIGNGSYYARVKVRGKIIRRSLDTDVFSAAKLRLLDFLKERRETLKPAAPPTSAEAQQFYEQQRDHDPAIKPQSRKYRPWCIRELQLPWPGLKDLRLGQIGAEARRAWGARLSQETACHPELERVELCAADILQPERKAAELTRVVAQTNHSPVAGRDVVVFTNRALLTGRDAAASLDLGAQISGALVEVARRLEVRPRYLIAKGGLTSSDLATKGLGAGCARVLGQILPGVPVWQLGPETNFPSLPCVVLPGNVGGPGALADAVNKFAS
jgi:hypothetical protein